VDLANGFRKLSLQNKMVTVVSLIALIIALPISIRWLYYRFTHAITNDAFVESDIVNVSPLVAGHLEKLYVDESDRVKKGELLATIEPSDYQAVVNLRRSEMEAAERKRAATEITLERVREEVEHTTRIAEDGIREAHETLRKAKAMGERVERDYERLKNLYERRVIAKSQFDAIKAEHEGMQASINSAQILVNVRSTELKRAITNRRQVDELEKNVSALKAQAESARHGLEVAELNLTHTRMESPIDGVIAKKFIYEGDFVSPGFPVFSVYDVDNVFVRAHLEETKMKGVKLGQEVDIEVDAYSRTFKGKVTKIGEATGAKFSLIPRDTTTGEFTKVVQRIPIEISVEDPEELLKPGYSVTVGIKLD